MVEKRDQKKHRSEKVDKKLEDIELPGFLSILMKIWLLRPF